MIPREILQKIRQIEIRTNRLVEISVPGFQLLRVAGISVVEKTLSYQDFQSADEIFATGNYSKVVPVTKIDDRTLPFGPLYTKARQLYWDFAHSR